ncbi:hypothetical protein EJD97_022268 [Solanum chilense]|uniref:CCHC-type domain-containing protein n=1 Tax=Solanum chilense TaxID=4083 RepID=A0A6N2CCK9_SOLCI|nr:hypothetical protein EJD97_022268 [Solanum chilense]
MNTRRNATRRLEEEIYNAGVPPRGDQVPPLKEVVVDDPTPSNPPPMKVAQMRAILSQMTQAITNQAQPTMVQAQAMISQANRDVAPRVHEQIMASGLGDFTRINPPIHYGSKVDEDPQEFIDEFYMILCSMGLSTNYNYEFKEVRAKRKDMNSKRARSFDGGATKDRLGIQDNPKYKKSLMGMENCFGCVKSGHKVKYCASIKGQEKSAQPSGSSDAPKKNRFYSLRTKGIVTLGNGGNVTVVGKYGIVGNFGTVS